MSNHALIQLALLRWSVDREAARSIDFQNQIPRCPCCRQQLTAQQTRQGPAWRCGCIQKTKIAS